MTWTDSVDLYCERTSPAFWAEPVNALTNLAFVVAAVAAFWLWRREGGRDGPALALIAVTAMVGIGSFLFHTVATRWAGMADVVPIAVFIYGYLALALRRYLGLGWAGTVLGLVLYTGLAAVLPRLVELPPGPWQGSLGYVPALAALAVTAAAVGWRGGAETARALAIAAGLFAVSLTLRSIDHAVCDMLPTGTHPLWHLLNAAVLYTLLAAAIRAAEPKRVPSADPALSR